MNAEVSRQSWDDGDTLAVQTAGAEEVSGDLDEAVAIFVGARPRLMAIAYRWLASTSEAEDVVQETWLRWQKTDRTVVADPQALLATMATRLAINVSQSARWRRETSMSASAPEGADAGDDPATRVETHEAVEQAVLIVMESLTPRERAAFILREAFDYPYGQISEFLHLGAANSRQLVSRARRHIAADRRTVVPSASYQNFLRAFLSAAQAGDLAGFEELLAADLAG
ncbi:RNA polymerase sigma factor (sigma-70 family) [Kribbella antiqua]|uniref:RNA polymerase sigma factor (Sigma-70 family) n=1 Tax=Kribbella antiqua TaxID=2512217 RepID=A0A4R2ICS5_9ACTN|nr:sigma-70 family RNA polymerase sigma factor [Kribbella antiqua]TCO42371.1 RNA polymerase sigma factor (sigma-70 family) [Kribbella antiqua]